MSRRNIEEKERIEIEFWRDAPEEKPDVFSIPNIINKFKEADIFFEKFVRHRSHFDHAKDILELGGGQGWASCIVKHYFPNKRLFLTDISEYAVEGAKQWEEMLKVKLDRKFAARSYDTGLDENSVDLIFCFASAHHFVKHAKTFEELKRILRPGGKVLYFHEPVCRSYIYPLSYRRANAKRPMVPEDVLIYKRLLKLADQQGFETAMHFDPVTRNRSVFGTLYYACLKGLPFLQHLLPCSADFVFTLKETP